MNDPITASSASPPDDLPPLVVSLAHYVTALRLESVPEAIKRQASLCLLDTVGCIVAGSQAEESRLLLRSEARRDTRREATVLCSDTRLSVEGATRVNGYMGDLLELNDLIGGHASIGNVTASLALGESLRASGLQLLEAVIAGLEVTARVYSAFYPGIKPFTDVGISSVGFPATIGVAAAAAKLLGLGPLESAHAMAGAGALAGWCPAEAVFGDGGSIKPMLFGSWPGTVGLMGAHYAKDRVTGPLRLLESRIGFFATMARRSDPAVVRDRDTWYLAHPRRKLHACCGYIHSAIDAVVAMRKRGMRFDDVAQIVIGMPEYVLPAVSKEAPPVSSTDAMFHAQYCLALAACRHDVIMPDHTLGFGEYLGQQGVAATMRKIRIRGLPDLSHYHQSRVEALDDRGSVLDREECLSPRGSSANPLSDDEVRSKFSDLAGARLCALPIDDYIRKVSELEREREIGWIVTAFG